MTKWLTILVAVLGLAVAIYTVVTHGSDRPPDPPPAAPPSVNPYARGIAGTGTVEAASRNIGISAPESGLVVEVLVNVGETVKKDQVLVRLDRRLIESELLRANAVSTVAKARIARLQAMPRAEELPPLVAAVDRSKAKLEDAEDMLADLTRAGAERAASRMEIDRRTFAVHMARAELVQSETQLKLMQAGAWDKEVAVAQAELAQAEAEIAAINLRLDRLVVRSPIDGTVLKRNVEPGQYLATGPGAAPSLVVGDLSTLRIRARIDEEDAPLLRPGAEGTARIRGIAAENVPLKMVRIEPLAQAKTDLVNTTTERVDTRVVEVVFELVGETKARLYPGQVVDVFIEAGK